MHNSMKLASAVFVTSVLTLAWRADGEKGMHVMVWLPCDASIVCHRSWGPYHAAVCLIANTNCSFIRGNVCKMERGPTAWSMVLQGICGSEYRSRRLHNQTFPIGLYQTYLGCVGHVVWEWKWPSAYACFGIRFETVYNIIVWYMCQCVQWNSIVCSGIDGGILL